jgi:signal transduction histidine kinase/AmiR/NasT family two-component response regulator
VKLILKLVISQIAVVAVLGLIGLFCINTSLVADTNAYNIVLLIMLLAMIIFPPLLILFQLYRMKMLQKRKDMPDALQGAFEKADIISDRGKLLLDCIPFPITLQDKNMMWTFVNKAMEKTFLGSIKREEVLGLPCASAGTHICNTEDCSIACVKRGIHQTAFRHEGLSYQVDTAELKGLDGEVTGYIEIIQDITQLEQLRITAETENRAKSSFLANMSHEIRTPLNAVIGMTTLGQSAVDVERMKYCFSRIESASTHLLGVINDILDISKIEANKFELSPVEFQFEKAIQQVINVISFRADEKHQKLSVHIDENIPHTFFGDDQRLAQVITNLLGNAIKFTPENGSIALDVHFLGEENGICSMQVEVRDTGVGISKELQSKLFKPFQQAESGTMRSFGGSGLGLAISKNIVEMMGGKIWVESEAGKGSEFIFTVQMACRNETASSANENVDDANKAQDITGCFAGRHVLLAEDVEINREIVIALLESTEVKIDCAENGAEAVRMFRESSETYDMIFMDVQMPEMDGYEATKQIRKLEAAAGFAKDETTAPSSIAAGNTRRNRLSPIPIIAMTANVFREDVEKSLDAGMNGHIGKPINFDEMIKVMREYLR